MDWLRETLRSLTGETVPLNAQALPLDSVTMGALRLASLAHTRLDPGNEGRTVEVGSVWDQRMDSYAFTYAPAYEAAHFWQRGTRVS